MPRADPTSPACAFTCGTSSRSTGVTREHGAALHDRSVSGPHAALRTGPYPVRMRNILIPLILCSGCVIDLDTEPEATTQSNLLCDPWCVPDDLEVQATLDGANKFAVSTFESPLLRGQTCIDLEPGTECLVTFATSSSPCG